MTAPYNVDTNGINVFVYAIFVVRNVAPLRRRFADEQMMGMNFQTCSRPARSDGAERDRIYAVQFACFSLAVSSGHIFFVPGFKKDILEKCPASGRQHLFLRMGRAEVRILDDFFHLRQLSVWVVREAVAFCYSGCRGCESGKFGVF